MRNTCKALPIIAGLLAVLVGGCDDGGLPTESPAESSSTAAVLEAGAPVGPHSFAPAVWDIAAAPDGGILVAHNTTIEEIRKHGSEEIATVPTLPGSPVNGLAPTGRGSVFATGGGLDLAAGAALWHVSNGRARLVGDIETFETDHDPDALEGPQWKNQLCEESPMTTAGPQSNPYHVAALSGSTALVADAAGNTLLSVDKHGHVDWVALLTPPLDGSGAYRFLKTAEGHPEIDCYVQPVATSVAVGPDGAYYVGELTGAPGPGGSGTGWSRIWRIEPGARHAVCTPTSTGDCRMLADGFTAIIDLDFGPDGKLYVVEYDLNGFLASLVPSIPLAGGRIDRCDVGTGSCELGVVSDLTLPGAITFDKAGDLWLLESNITAPEVRKLDRAEWE